MQAGYAERIEAVLVNTSHPEVRDPQVAQSLTAYIEAASQLPIFRGVLVAERVAEPRISLKHVTDLPLANLARYAAKALHGEELEAHQLSDLGLQLTGDGAIFEFPMHYPPRAGLPDMLGYPEAYVRALNRTHRSTRDEERLLGVILPQKP